MPRSTMQIGQSRSCRRNEEPFRVLPAVGEPYVVAEADGSMVCTVAPGPRKGKKPRDWKEIRLAAARGLNKTDTVYDILLLYRPGTLDAEDPEVENAINFVRNDPELTAWFQQHQLFQAIIRAKFRQIETPEHLKIALLGPKETPLPHGRVWQTQVWLAAAALMFRLPELRRRVDPPAAP
jgi:hypothetical protein